MRLPPGQAPDPTVEKLHVSLTPSSAVPCKSRHIALLVGPTYNIAGCLADQTFLVNKRNVAYFNIACPSQSMFILYLQYLRYWVKLTCLIIRYIYKTNQSALYKIRHGACTNSCLSSTVASCGARARRVTAPSTSNNFLFISLRSKSDSQLSRN